MAGGGSDTYAHRQRDGQPVRRAGLLRVRIASGGGFRYLLLAELARGPERKTGPDLDEIALIEPHLRAEKRAGCQVKLHQDRLACRLFQIGMAPLGKLKQPPTIMDLGAIFVAGMPPNGRMQPTPDCRDVGFVAGFGFDEGQPDTGVNLTVRSIDDPCNGAATQVRAPLDQSLHFLA